jgi:hypothetical protein
VEETPCCHIALNSVSVSRENCVTVEGHFSRQFQSKNRVAEYVDANFPARCIVATVH